jgi:hypothetical protein
MVSTATIALIHAHDIHTGSPGFLRDADDIAGLARPFEPVHNNNGESRFPLRLPMTMAQNFNPGSYFNVAFLHRRQLGAPRQEESCQRLQVSAAKEAPRPERWRLKRSLPGTHILILNNLLLFLLSSE